MFVKRLLIVVSLWILTVFSPLSLFAQADLMKVMRSNLAQRTQQVAGKAAIRSMWNGNAGNMMLIQLTDEPEIRQALEITDEQHQQIKGTATNQALFMNHPEFPALVGEMQKFVDPSDPLMENADEERISGFLGVQEKIMTLVMDAVPAEIDRILSEEQREKLKVFQLAAMSESPLVTPDTFDVLGLSEDQKKELESVKKELEPEFEKMMDEAMELQFRNLDKVYDRIEKEGGEIKDQKVLQEKMLAAMKEINQNDEEVRKANEELGRKGQAFMTRLKFKMFDVLNDEQMAALEEMIAHPPEYVSNIIKTMKEKYGQTGQTDPARSAFEAWKPGEPIPEEYRQQRKKKGFPQKEESNTAP